MKWTIHELKKIINSDNEIDQDLSLNSFLSDDFNDLVNISNTHVSGYFDYIREEDIYGFYLNIKTTLTMLCSITLKEVDVVLDFNADLYFSQTSEDDDVHHIDGITIDLIPYIFSEIITEKPMRVIAPGAYDEYEEEIETLDEEEIVNNSPFAKLKK